MEVLSELNGIGPVLYDRVPDGAEAKEILYKTLFYSLRRYDPSWGETDLDLQTDYLGGPLLKSSKHEGPSISYSHGSGKLYGAMSGMGHVGCDFSPMSDFELNYPVGRAFSPQEWGKTLDVCGQPESAAAMLWSVKEAVVKALGTGFHYYDPLEFEVEPLSPHENGFLNIVWSDKPFVAWSVFKEDGWFSLSVVRRQVM